MQRVNDDLGSDIYAVLCNTAKQNCVIIDCIGIPCKPLFHPWIIIRRLTPAASRNMQVTRTVPQNPIVEIVQKESWNEYSVSIVTFPH